MKSKGVRYMYGIPVPFPSGPSLTDITFTNGKVGMSLRLLIVATEVQSIKGGKTKLSQNTDIPIHAEDFNG